MRLTWDITIWLSSIDGDNKYSYCIFVKRDEYIGVIEHTGAPRRINVHSCKRKYRVLASGIRKSKPPEREEKHLKHSVKGYFKPP